MVFFVTMIGELGIVGYLLLSTYIAIHKIDKLLSIDCVEYAL